MYSRISNNRTAKSKGVIPFTCWAFKLILTFVISSTTSNCPSLQGMWNRILCMFIRYSRVLKNGKIIRFFVSFCPLCAGYANVVLRFCLLGGGEMGWKIRSPCQIRVWRQTTFWLVCSLWPLEYICHCRCLFFACHGSTWSQVKRRCCSSSLLAFHLNIDNKSQLLECTQCKNSFKLLKVSFTTFHLDYYFFPSSLQLMHFQLFTTLFVHFMCRQF